MCIRHIRARRFVRLKEQSNLPNHRAAILYLFRSYFGALSQFAALSNAGSHADYDDLILESALEALCDVVTLLFRAGKQLDEASRTAPDKYHAARLRFLPTGVQDVTLPLCRIASHLQKRGVR